MITLSNIKKIVSVVIGIPAVIIFAGEAGVEYFGLQILSAMVIIGLLAWNGMFRRPYERV